MAKITQDDPEEVVSALGLKMCIMHYYEKGEKFEIPKAITLACYALTLGVASYSGPEPNKKKIEANILA